MFFTIKLSGAAGASLSDELSSVKGSPAFSLVAFKVSSSGAGPNTAGILFSVGWSMLLHTVQLRVGLFCRVLLLNRTIGMSSSDKLKSVKESSASGLVVSKVSPSGVDPSIIGIPPSTDWFSLLVSLSDGGIDSWKGHSRGQWSSVPYKRPMVKKPFELTCKEPEPLQNGAKVLGQQLKMLKMFLTAWEDTIRLLMKTSSMLDDVAFWTCSDRIHDCRHEVRSYVETKSQSG